MGLEALYTNMSQTTQSTLDNSSNESSGIGIITETNSRDVRKANLDELCDEISKIDGVDEAVWDATPTTLQDAVIRPVLEYEEKMFSNNVTIEADLRTITNKINKVLDKNDEKHNATWKEVNAPRYVDTNEYKDTFYEVELAMI
jgi:uncharacterized Fe-S cluster-containing MiaB family protein